ncbi:MAG: hypothetical protein M1824_004287 [Vezdaea acicularis]|nr:MAG: hypothetical protein M1824_004287 [Vezdaea acicularis]
MAYTSDLYRSPAEFRFSEDDVVLDEDILSDFTTPEFSGELGTRQSTTKFQSNNPFASSFDQSWDDASGATTPMAVYDGYPTDFDTASTPYLSSSTMGTAPFEIATASHIRPTAFPSGSSSSVSIPHSPHHGGRDWMSSIASEQQDPRSIPKRMRPSSPRPTSPLVRRDGIRKKNARFEIPAERTLTNIDNLIQQSSDDQEIKELKQQKRLLRNRQAALDSRQRKKQHTERLEEEKKHYTELISELEDKVAQLEVRENEHCREREDWKATQAQYDQYIDNMRFEKEEMVRRHTLETGDLRKKNSVLVEAVQKLETASISTGPSSAGYPTDFSDIDSITMDSSWENFVINDFPMESDQRTDTALVPVKAEKLAISEEDKPTASSLLLILLLCGAFVASKSSTSSTPAIPRMPDDIRAASATVLDNIFKDAGIQQADPRLMNVNRVEVLEPAPSGIAWPAPSKTAFGESSMVGLSSSSLEVLSHHLITPTKEQEAEQLFSLSAEQYNGVTSHEFGEREPASPSQHRRNLEASLAAMRENSKATAAEVYTRSLMWDKVPTEVVRDFAKLVAEANKADRESAE